MVKSLHPEIIHIFLLAFCRLVGFVTCTIVGLIPHFHSSFFFLGADKAKGMLNWDVRMKIALGAARGLAYLHEDSNPHVIHRDFKASNILLEEDFTPKVTDFGMSKVGLPNEPQANVVGTIGYCDPSYWEIGFLSKESDVYSFGIVLFEVMSGRLCYEYHNGQLIGILVPRWKKYYEEKRLDDIINHDLKKQMEHGSLNTFSAIAYQCLKKSREERPSMAEVVKELEIALEQQVSFL